jgi:hypothetical protein
MTDTMTAPVSAPMSITVSTCTCTHGIIGWFDGVLVYCQCRLGLDAKMSAIAALGLDIAAAITHLEALETMRGLLPPERERLSFFRAEYQINAAQYEELEKEWYTQEDTADVQTTEYVGER